MIFGGIKLRFRVSKFCGMATARIPCRANPRVKRVHAESRETSSAPMSRHLANKRRLLQFMSSLWFLPLFAARRDCLVPSLCSSSVRASNHSAGWDLVRTSGWFALQRHAQRQMAHLQHDGTFVCYSGLVGSGGPALLRRQLDFLQALSRVPVALRGDIYVALSRAMADGLDRESARMFHAQFEANGNSSGVVRVVTALRPAEGAYFHPQFAGIAHCGELARSLEQERGRLFAFAIRIRYDLQLWPSALDALPSWPIWHEYAEASVLAFGKKHRCNDMRCLPQDVFFVSRFEPDLQGCDAPSVACGFAGLYTQAGRMDITSGDVRDSFEAALFGPWLQSAQPMYVVWTRWWCLQDCTWCGGDCEVGEAEGRTPGAGAGELTVALHVPRERLAVFYDGLANVPNYRAPAVVQTPSGLVAFAEARDGGNSSASRIATRVSLDDGATWSVVTFVASLPTCQASIVSSNGATYFSSISKDSAGRTHLTIKRSSDSAATWGSELHMGASWGSSCLVNGSLNGHEESGGILYEAHNGAIMFARFPLSMEQ